MATKRKGSAKKPSRGALAVAEQMLAPLKDMLSAHLAQGEINAEALAKLQSSVEKLAGQLDRLQALAPAEPKQLLTEPAPVPTDRPLVE